jgi:molybdenum cofactor guanylyltransferase
MAGSHHVTAFVLAGGKSTRMGADKAFLIHDGRTLLERTVELARSVAFDACIVGSAEKFAAYGAVVEDILKDCGPLGGIHAALSSAQTDLNLMLAVDMPFLTPQFLRYLVDKARGSQATATVPRANGRLQPLCAVYRPDFICVAEASLRSGRNKIEPLFAEVDTLMIEEDELMRAGFQPHLFHNLNTTEDFQRAARLSAP